MEAGGIESSSPGLLLSMFVGRCQERLPAPLPICSRARIGGDLPPNLLTESLNYILIDAEGHRKAG